MMSLSSVETDNHGRTLPLTVAERLLHRQIFQGTGDYAGMSVEERRALMVQTFLPRPKRNLQSSQYVLDAKLDMPVGENHYVVFGGQAIDGELDDGVFGMEEGDDGAGIVQEHRMWSVFAEDNWTPGDALTVTAGIRHDDHNMFGSQLSPRLYANYNLSSAWVLKGGVSTGFKTPKTTDLYDGVIGFGAQGTTPFIGNPELQPETSVNSEIALYWNSGNAGHNFNITVFNNDFKDKIARGETNLSCAQTGGVRPCANLGDYELLGYGTYAQNINIDQARVRGAEVAGRYEFFDGLAIRANYTYTDSEQLSGAQKGLPLTNTAEHMANATLEWTMSEKFGMQLIGENRSERYRGSLDADGNPLYYKGYTVWHLAAQYRFNDNISIGGRINNLLDKDFTSFQTIWAQDPQSGAYAPSYLDDYNTKDKSRNLWLSLNVGF